ncbi:MAG: hypothetical protein ACI9C1_000832 [Candidatus Aldehydirespiratoraceae bacterium]|jgi:hypothetical protein
MRSFFVKNWKILTPIGVIVAIVAGYLVFVVFAFQTLFIDDKVDEDGPVFTSGVVAESDGMPAAADVPAEDVDTPAEDLDMPAEEPLAPVEPAIQTLIEGSFVDRDHPAEGIASVLTDGTAQRFLRFEEFATDNGPDLNVYLSSAPLGSDDNAFDDDFIDLGDLRGNIGSQNYEIPEDVDLDRYTTVVIWCVRFGVAFAAAELT